MGRVVEGMGLVDSPPRTACSGIPVVSEQALPPPPLQVFPLGPMLHGTMSQVEFPDLKIFSVAASSVFSIP